MENVRIEEIKKEEDKKQIAETILSALPDWFDEEGKNEYPNKLDDKKVFTVFTDNVPVGFIGLKQNNHFTLEVFVLGVLKEYQRQGLGSALLERAEKFAMQQNYILMMVKTLGKTANYKPYEETRQFYLNREFYPLEEFQEIWDEENPCLILVKPL